MKVPAEFRPIGGQPPHLADPGINCQTPYLACYDPVTIDGGNHAGRNTGKLVRRGEVIKTLGGVQTAHASKDLYESPIQERLAVGRAEKERIAQKALREIKSHQTIFLDGSTTCLVLARQLAKELRGLTVVTHSALVCMEFGPCFGPAIDPQNTPSRRKMDQSPDSP